MSTKKYISYILYILSIIIVLSGIWIMKYFDNPTFEQILYHIYTPIKGTDLRIIFDYCLYCLLIPCLIVLLLFIFKKVINKLFEKTWVRNIVLISSFFVFLGSTYFFLAHIGCISYFTAQREESTFIEENYIAPDDVTLTFPKEKRNLIVLYLESMESSFSETKKGGLFTTNYIPNLTKIANDNISFSNNKKLGGANWIYGTGWTTAGLVNTIAGIPIKTPFSGDAANENPFSFPKISTLGEILDKAGYKEKLILGSEAEFGGINDFFTNHGNFEIYDIEIAKNTGYLDSNNSSSWGLQDKALLEYAKKDLSELSKTDTPFYYNIITIDTHVPSGYTSSDCKNSYKDKYANAISCSDKHVADFVNWIKEQDFYSNTTLVIMGDHLSMNGDFFKNVDASNRRIYNAFLNSAVATKNTKNREFYQMDYFPTILASIGVKIEGERLGLGTNLFSDEQTLIEKYGYEEVNSNLSKYSKFYNDNILY